MVFSILHRTVLKTRFAHISGKAERVRTVRFFVAENKNGAPLSPSPLLTMNLTMKDISYWLLSSRQLYII